MLKYVDTQVTFAEIPDEVSLCINISNCPMRCVGCHSPYLAENIGESLDEEAISRLVEKNKGITCLCFMGGDIAPHEVNDLAGYIRKEYPCLKIGWYSGADELTLFTEWKNFDYIKLGRYRRKFGGLASSKTNQRLYRVDGIVLRDITNRFWEKSQ